MREGATDERPLLLWLREGATRERVPLLSTVTPLLRDERVLPELIDVPRLLLPVALLLRRTVVPLEAADDDRRPPPLEIPAAEERGADVPRPLKEDAEELLPPVALEESERAEERPPPPLPGAYRPLLPVPA